jgi:BON domain
MLRATFFACGIAASLAFGLPSAVAQQFGGGGNSGFGGGSSGSGFGSSGFGGGGGGSFGSGTGGFSGFGGSGFGGSSNFGGGFSNAFGSNGIGSGGGGGQGFGQGLNGGGQFNGGGQGGQGGQQFVGRSDSDMQSMMKSLGKNSNQFFQQLNRTLGQGNKGKQSQQKENATLPVRVRLNVAFDSATPSSPVLATSLHTHIDKLLAARKMGAPDIEVDGDTVVLRGTAESESQRLVIEKLVSLEPGVSQVLNQMTVAGSFPGETAPQPAGN